MIARCRSCGVDTSHVSPGCAEHARREAQEIHAAHLVNDGDARRCPVCLSSAPTSRRGRRAAWEGR